MRKGLFVAAMLCLTATTMQAELVVVETKNTTLVLDVEKGQQPKYVYYGQKLSAQELQHLQRGLPSPWSEHTCRSRTGHDPLGRQYVDSPGSRVL